MGIEIERKFLVADDGWRQAAASRTRFSQGYLVGRSSVDIGAFGGPPPVV